MFNYFFLYVIKSNYLKKFDFFYFLYIVKFINDYIINANVYKIRNVKLKKKSKKI